MRWRGWVAAAGAALVAVMVWASWLLIAASDSIPAVQSAVNESDPDQVNRAADALAPIQDRLEQFVTRERDRPGVCGRLTNHDGTGPGETDQATG